MLFKAVTNVLTGSFLFFFGVSFFFFIFCVIPQVFCLEILDGNAHDQPTSVKIT
jgi:hypothetical protein